MGRAVFNLFASFPGFWTMQIRDFLSDDNDDNNYDDEYDGYDDNDDHDDNDNNKDNQDLSVFMYLFIKISSEKIRTCTFWEV